MALGAYPVSFRFAITSPGPPSVRAFVPRCLRRFVVPPATPAMRTGHLFFGFGAGVVPPAPNGFGGTETPRRAVGAALDCALGFGVFAGDAATIGAGCNGCLRDGDHEPAGNVPGRA